MDGSISESFWLLWLDLLGLEGPVTWCRHQEAAVEACFQRLDAEANGYITREDLTRPWLFPSKVED